MRLVKSSYNDKPTFSLIPVSKDCPYVEGIFDTEKKVLAIIGSAKKQCFALVKSLDVNGDPIPVKIGKRDDPAKYKQERLSVEKYQEYYIEDKEDINQFLEAVAENSKSFKYAEFLK